LTPLALVRGFENDFFLGESEASVERTVPRSARYAVLSGRLTEGKGAALFENDGVLDRVFQFGGCCRASL